MATRRSFALLIWLLLLGSRVGALEQDVANQVGVGTDETHALTGGWINDDFAWSHTNILIHGTVLSAEMSIDLADADAATFSIYHNDTNGMRIGVATGGDNGGPGTWPVLGDPGSVDNVLSLPTDTFADIAAGTLTLDGRNDGMGWWGSNRAQLRARVQPQRSRLIADQIGGYDDPLNSLTDGWTSGGLIWTHSVEGVAGGTIISAILELDLTDADATGLDLMTADGVRIGLASGPDNGAPGPWRRIGDAGNQDNVFVLPCELFDDLGDGSLKLVGIDIGMGTWGANRSRLSVNVMPYTTTTVVCQVGNGISEVGSLSGGWVDTGFTWTNTDAVIEGGVVISAVLEMDTLDVEPGTDVKIQAGDNTPVGVLGGRDNGGPGAWQALRVGNDVDHFLSVPPSLFEAIEAGNLILEAVPNGAGWWGANRARLTANVLPAPAGSVRVQVGDGVHEATSLSGGWVSGTVTWTNRYAAIEGCIALATLEADMLDGDGAWLDLYSGEGVHLGAITSGDTGGPGPWQPIGSDASEYSLLALPPDCYSDLVDGQFVIRAEDRGGAGVYGMNRAVLTIVYKPSDVRITAIEEIATDAMRVTWTPEFGKGHFVRWSLTPNGLKWVLTPSLDDSVTNFVDLLPPGLPVGFYDVIHTP